VLYYKRLEYDKFAWPKVQDGMMRLAKAQFEALFEGLDWRRVMARADKVIVFPLRVQMARCRTCNH
jgi:transposase